MKALEFLQEPSGKLSVKRVILAALTLSFLFLWIRTGITNKVIPDVPAGIQTLFLILLGSKAAEKAIEQKNSP